MHQKTISDCSVIKLPNVTRSKFNVIPMHPYKTVPFPIARVFYTYGIPADKTRGAHAHKKLEEFLVASRGNFDVKLDDGFRTTTVRLDRPDIGIYIPPMIWITQVNFSEDAICLVMASLKYSESDYIRDYKKFLVLARSFKPAPGESLALGAT